MRAQFSPNYLPIPSPRQMARSRFSNPDDAQHVDVRVRKTRETYTVHTDEDSGPVPKKLIWWSSTHIFLALLALIMICAWIVRKNGGFAWKDPARPIGSVSYHGLFMIVGFVVLSGVSDILYRMCRNSPKLSVKIAHATLHTLGFAFVVTALCAIFWYHDVVGGGHLRSAHSWIGLIIVLLLSLQWVVGFIGFLIPGFKPTLRAAYTPVHMFNGRALFVLSLVNIVIGINKVGSGTTTMNCLALIIILFGLNGGYILGKDCFARDSRSSSPDYQPIGQREPEEYGIVERRVSVHSRGSGPGSYRDVDRPEVNKTYINVSGTGGTYQSLSQEDPAVREALSTGRDTFSRFQERLEKKKHIDLPGEFVATTTTVTD